MQLLPSVPSCDDETRIFEHSQMLHHAEARHIQLGLELGKRAAVTLEEPVEEEAPRRVCERLEDTIVVVHRTSICDQIVTCQDPGYRGSRTTEKGWINVKKRLMVLAIAVAGFAFPFIGTAHAATTVPPLCVAGSVGGVHLQLGYAPAGPAGCTQLP
jgi:hypothetical protein